jgi:hypothetical protein
VRPPDVVGPPVAAVTSTNPARIFGLPGKGELLPGLDADFVVVDLAAERSQKNPVYYVQYAHARIASIFRTAAERGVSADAADVSLLTAPAEIELTKALLRFPELLDDVLERRAVHLLTVYALELAGAFGDIGTDLPLIVGMVLSAGLDAASVLIMFGLRQYMTAVRYGMPMAVQPLKAMAVIVITQQIAGPVLFGAGLAIGVVMLKMATTMLLEGLTVEIAAERFSVTVRTVFRIMRRCREAVTELES